MQKRALASSYPENTVMSEGESDEFKYHPHPFLLPSREKGHITILKFLIPSPLGGRGLG